MWNRTSFLTLFFGGALLVGSLACSSSDPVEEGGPIRRTEPIEPLPENPSYWRYDGAPVLLLGGSTEDNLFQIPNLEAHLDSLAAAGGNYVRNTMSSRDEGNLWPFHRQEDGRYDLERLNDAYYQRFERLLQEAYERDVIVQVELWDRFDYARDPWQDNPFRPANNVNYTPEESGLANTYEKHPASNQNPFFRSIPAEDENRVLLPYQRARIDSLLNISLQYPNVLYVIDNETDATSHWPRYWASFVKNRAAEAGRRVFVTEMWDAWDLKDPHHRHTLDHPELYDFADVSQNNHNTGQEHWDNLQWMRRYVDGRPRPLNNVKIYGADTGEYGTTRDGLERFWRSILGGAASARFHRPESGIGLSAVARAHLRSARRLSETFDVVRARPDSASTLLRDRTPDEAYLSRIPGEAYAVYFPDGGSVALDLSGRDGPFQLRWLEAATGAWQEGASVSAGQTAALSPPAEGHWVGLLTR